MNIEFNEETIKAMVEKRVDELVTKDFEKLINDLVVKRVDEVARRITDVKSGLVETINFIIEKVARETVTKRLEEMNLLSEEGLKKVADDIADTLTWKLRTGIIESVAFRLAPDNNEDEED